MTTDDRLEWRTSSYSGNNGGGCVDVAPADNRVFVRHAKHHNHGVIIFSSDAWSSFVQEAQLGSPSANGTATVRRVGDDTIVDAIDSNVQLRFNDREWTAFVAGAEDGEFDFAAVR